jgi:Asp-tRNA(Asn)/Glu-tRNA(Gln) amidotransferase B subunit
MDPIFVIASILGGIIVILFLMNFSSKNKEIVKEENVKIEKIEKEEIIEKVVEKIVKEEKKVFEENKNLFTILKVSIHF